MSIKSTFIDIWPQHVYAIDTLNAYVDKMRFLNISDETKKPGMEFFVFYQNGIHLIA